MDDLPEDLGVSLADIPKPAARQYRPERKPYEISGPIWTPSKPGDEPPF